MEKIKLRNKRLIYLLFCCIFSLIMVNAFSIIIVKADENNNITINTDNITLYGVSNNYADLISIPESMPESFKIEVTGAKNVTYKVVYGTSVIVDENGLVKPKITTYYYYGSMGTTAKKEDKTPDKIVNYYSFSQTIIEINADGELFYVNVSVEDYSDYCANEILDEYISQHITSSMSEYEIGVEAYKFVANYDYSASYSSFRGMVLSGGGDCWASAETIITFLDKCGIKAWIEQPNKYESHLNAMAELDGQYYVLHAGFSGKAPRYYYIATASSLYYTTYNYEYDGYFAYLYNGPKQVIDTIPATVNDKKIIGIDTKYLTYDSSVEKVVISEGIEVIDDYAFVNCYNLKTVVIPSTVKVIGEGAFSYCYNLTDIQIDSNNPYFVCENGVIYNKDKTKIISVPAVSVIDIPLTVTEIGDGAFSGNRNIKEIIIPENIKSIGTSAFSKCSSLNSISFLAPITEIKESTFENNGSLKYISLPDTVESIGANAFKGSTKLEYIEFKGRKLTSIQNQAFYNTKITKIELNNTITELGNNIFSTPANVTIYCNQDSVAYEYANQNGYNVGILCNNHSWIDANCTEPKICKNCGTIKGFPNGHSYSCKVDSGTCKTREVLEYTCVNCDKFYWTYGNYGDHNYKLTSTKDATCTADGLKTYTCSNCSGTKTETIKATGHSYTTKVVSATNYTDGYTLHTCSTCGYEYKSDYVYKFIPDSPANFKMIQTKQSSVTVGWDKVDGADGYIIEEFNASGNWVQVAKITKNSTINYKISNLTSGSTYKYRIKSYKFLDKAAYMGAYSDTITAITKPGKTTAKTKSTTSNSVTLSWDKVTGADGYIIEKYVGNGAWERVAKVESGSTLNYTVTGLTTKTKYSFRVIAYNYAVLKKTYLGIYSENVSATTK